MATAHDSLPRLHGDRTLELYRDPYGFIASHCRRLGTQAFCTRILLEPTICISGEDAARFFYAPGHTEREGAAPRRVQKTLFGTGGVQGLDGAAHRHRKEVFTRIMDRPGLLDETLRAWEEEIEAWDGPIVLYDAAKRVLGTAVCRWAGVPMDAAGIDQLASLYEGAGHVGPQHWRARRNRRRLERRFARTIEEVRSGGRAEGTVLETVALHTDLDGQQLPPETAAVELLNILRPTVAVAVYVVFVAHALHEHPQYTEDVRNDADFARRFVQEVRRSYPFFPAVAAKVRQTTSWRGHRFPKGTRVLLDLHGTDHDPGLWTRPEEFRPDRHLDRKEDGFTLVPQGGGDRDGGHRCAGEPVTVPLMEQAARILAAMDYAVPPQDLSLGRAMPPLPEDRFVMEVVKSAA